MNKLKGLFILAAMICLLGNSTDTKLQSVVTQIQLTKIRLKKNHRSQEKTLNLLRRYEVSIAHLHSELDELSLSKQKQKKSLDKINNHLIALTRVKTQQEQQLHDIVNSSYYIEKKNTLKTLFNQQDRSKIDRLHEYQKILATTYAKQIEAIQKTMLTIKENKLKAKISQSELEKLENQYHHEQTLLISHMKERKELLKNLNKKIGRDRRRLQSLKKDKKNLDKVIAKLKLTEEFTTKYFIKHKHKLPWPAKGKIISSYDTRVASSKLHFNATLIKAKEGASVKAVAPGKVVFSDWLSGFGLLLIIDHGGGYMSIYGHNKTLNNTVGDHVDTGNVVSTVGESGGLSNSQLYFSIRHNGKALDPEDWCQKMIS